MTSCNHSFLPTTESLKASCDTFCFKTKQLMLYLYYRTGFDRCNMYIAYALMKFVSPKKFPLYIQITVVF